MVTGMKRITANIYYEGNNADAGHLRDSLKDLWLEHPFATGVDWDFQVFWATMTDEQCLMFLLKHPEYTDRFSNG